MRLYGVLVATPWASMEWRGLAATGPVGQPGFMPVYSDLAAAMADYPDARVCIIDVPPEKEAAWKASEVRSSPGLSGVPRG